MVNSCTLTVEGYDLRVWTPSFQLVKSYFTNLNFRSVAGFVLRIKSLPQIHRPYGFNHFNGHFQSSNAQVSLRWWSRQWTLKTTLVKAEQKKLSRTEGQNTFQAEKARAWSGGFLVVYLCERPWCRFLVCHFMVLHLWGNKCSNLNCLAGGSVGESGLPGIHREPPDLLRLKNESKKVCDLYAL